MASLYKRYTPPKPVGAPANNSAPTPATEQLAAQPSEDEQKKRKRERSGEEVAERKAKKLRKKGADATTVEVAENQRSTQEAVEPTVSGPKPSFTSELLLDARASAPDTRSAPRSEFAHVKNIKKRHKLEKQARKARKTAEKEQKESGVVEPAANDEGQQLTGDPGTVGHEKGADLSLPGHGDSEEQADGAVESKRRTKRRKDEGGEGPLVRAATTRSETQAAGDEVKGGADSDDVVNERAKEDKRQRKAEKRASRDAEESTPSNDTADVEMDEADDLPSQEHDHTLSQPKKRRHKLESALEGQDTATQEQPADDEHLRKHGGVLGKFAKATKSSSQATSVTKSSQDQQQGEDVLRDLIPIPQPEKAPTPDFIPDGSLLPGWLAKPTIVSREFQSTFVDMELETKALDRLTKLGLKDALPIQRALIPLLLPPGTPGASFLPGTDSVLPDLAVSAPTGSGKTIAYLLPMLQSLKETAAAVGGLKALIVVPTRELVTQVAAVAESLVKGSSTRIGAATATGSFKDEQSRLISRGQRYDPRAHRELLARAHRHNYPPAEDSEEFEHYMEELEDEDPKQAQRVQEAVETIVDHVPTYNSAVDVLVATPGRLLEHLAHTLGFTLSHLNWLVLDEADKLLDQQYEGFLEAINHEISRPRLAEEQDAREKHLRSHGRWEEYRERRTRKVVLSATMTRDISKLLDLKLHRPQMVIVRGDRANALDEGTAADHDKELGDDFELPPTLNEYCVPVGDGSEKPLYLLELLNTKLLPAKDNTAAAGASERRDHGSNTSSSDSSDSDSDSDSESSADSSSSDSTSASPLSSPRQSQSDTAAIHPSRASNFTAPSVPTVLIFTSSTTSATRLTHLLRHLSPSLSPHLHTVTRSHALTLAPRTNARDPIIAIATDRAARGLDALAGRPITHVLQYDVPRSLTGYVHRVGRTARAGRRGEAWTFCTHAEGRWFFGEVGAKGIAGRRERVAKVPVMVEDERMRERLVEVVGEMRGMVFGGKKGD